METQPIMSFKSRIEGKNADVRIYPDRVEWGRDPKFRPGQRGSEMIPIKSVSSVTTEKDGLTSEKLQLICSGNVIEMRASKSTIEEAKDHLTRLVLGSHPTQQGAAASPPSPPPPPSSGPPAGWFDDPNDAGQLRYWDGNTWTEHAHPKQG